MTSQAQRQRQHAAWTTKMDLDYTVLAERDKFFVSSSYLLYDFTEKNDPLNLLMFFKV